MNDKKLNPTKDAPEVACHGMTHRAKGEVSWKASQVSICCHIATVRFGYATTFADLPNFR
jgi:hypothetical protein